MPDRTKEDYQQIYNDLIEIRKLANELAKRGSFRNKWFNGKSGAEEKKEFYQTFVDGWGKLLETVQSCECYKLVKYEYEGWKNVRDREYKPLKSGFLHKDSTEWFFGKYNLDQLIEEVNKSTRTEKTHKQLDQALDKFGNCNSAQACNDKVLEEARNLAFDPETVTILNTEKVSSKNETTRTV